MRVLVLLAVTIPLLFGCGGADNTLPAVDEGSCSFRVTGATVDSFDAQAFVSLEGSTLSLGCSRNQGARTSLVLLAALKAFTGSNTYTIDNTKTFGEAKYNGNDGHFYFSTSSNTETSCSFAIVGAANPQPGDEVTATFSCRKLEAYVGSGNFANVDVLAGTLRAKIASP